MAIAPVVIEFLAKGMPQVQQAFQSIHAAAVKAERAQQVEADKTTKAVKKATDERVKMQIAAMRKVDAMQRAARAAGDREAQRVEKARIQSEERIAKAKIAAMKAADKLERQARAAGLKEAEQFAKRQQAIRDQSAKMAGQFAAKQAREEAAVAKRAEQERYRAVQDRIGRTKQAEKDLDAWQRSQQRNAAKAARAKAAREQASADRAEALGRVVESVTGAAFRGVGAGLSRAGNMAMGLANTAAQLGGGFSIADSVMGEANLRKQAATLSASTLLTGKKGDEIGTDAILGRAKAIGLAQNIDPSEVLSAFDSTKKLTGDLGMAMDLAPTVAKISKATGSDMSDVSALAGNILANRGKYDPKDKAKVQADVESQLRVLTKQGIVGGVELEDFAKYGARLTAGSVYFGGDKSTNEATLGAMAQMSKQYGGASSPAEAALASQRFSTDVANHADKLKANLGIDARDGKGNIRDAQSLILEMLQKTGGDVTKLKDTGLGERGVKPLVGAANLYKAAGGGEKGLQAVKDEFKKYTGGVSEDAIEAAAKRVLAEQQAEKAMLDLKIAAGEQLLPVFKDMIPVLKDIIPQLVQMAKVGIPAFTSLMDTVAKFVPALAWLVDSFGPIPTLIGYELTKSFAAAGLPALLRALFNGAFNGKTPTVQPPGSGGTPGGTSGAGALEGGLITGGIALAVNGYQNYEAGDKRASELAAAVRSGAISPDAAQREIAAAKGRLAERNSFGNSLLRGAAGVIAPGAGVYNSYKDSQSQGDVGLASNKELQRAIAEAAAAGVREGVASGLKNNSGAQGSGRSESIINR